MRQARMRVWGCALWDASSPADRCSWCRRRWRPHCLPTSGAGGDLQAVAHELDQPGDDARAHQRAVRQLRGDALRGEPGGPRAPPPAGGCGWRGLRACPRCVARPSSLPAAAAGLVCSRGAPLWQLHSSLPHAAPCLQAERERMERSEAELSHATFSPEISRLAQQLWSRQEGGMTPAWQRLSRGGWNGKQGVRCGVFSARSRPVNWHGTCTARQPGTPTPDLRRPPLTSFPPPPTPLRRRQDQDV